MSYYSQPDPGRSRRTSFDDVGEGIRLLNSNLGVWAAATLLLMVISALANAPLQVVQQIQMAEWRETQSHTKIDLLMFFKPPWIWWYFVSLPFSALVMPLRISMSRMALRS